ncbi:hypothetical protein MJO29_005433, partial [Puccinia striiformis f. sp. tritici]
ITEMYILVINLDKWVHYLQQDHVDSNDYPHQALLHVFSSASSISERDRSRVSAPLINTNLNSQFMMFVDAAPSLVGLCVQYDHIHQECIGVSSSFLLPGPSTPSPTDLTFVVRLLTCVSAILTCPAFLRRAEVEYNYPLIM